MNRDKIVIFKKFVLELLFNLKPFVRFLKENGYFAAYVKNTRNMIIESQNGKYDKSLFMTTLYPSFLNDLISVGFVWRNTPEGEDYWYNAYESWKSSFNDMSFKEKEKMRKITIDIASEKYPSCIAYMGGTIYK